LPDADVHCGQFEGSRFHDPAAGIADQHGEKLQKAQIRTMIDAGNKPCIRPARGESGDALQKLTAAAFGQRRKMLRASLKALGGEALIEAAGLDPQARAETIDVAGFLRLADAWIVARAP